MSLDKRKLTTMIVVHSSATPPAMDIGAAEIDVWHRRIGFVKVGYHFVIRRSGLVETGRAVDEIGAHARPRNYDSVGICMVGGLSANGKDPEANFTPEQFAALEEKIIDLQALYPNASIVGHRDVPGSPATACPSFDVAQWWSTTTTKRTFTS